MRCSVDRPDCFANVELEASRILCGIPVGCTGKVEQESAEASLKLCTLIEIQLLDISVLEVVRQGNSIIRNYTSY